jgi:hypothetical protein
MSGLFGGSTPTPPKPIEMPAQPKVDQAVIDREAGDMMRRRRGRAATVLNTGGDVPAGSVATKTLLGE